MNKRRIITRYLGIPPISSIATGNCPGQCWKIPRTDAVAHLPLVMRTAARCPAALYLRLKQKWHWRSIYSIHGWTYFKDSEGMACAGGLAQPKGHPAPAAASTAVTSCTAGDHPAQGNESQALGLSAHPLHATCPTPDYAFPFKPQAYTAATVCFGCSHGSLIKE